MYCMHRITGALLATATLFIAGIQPAAAQSYPERPIRLIVPFPPGGGTDSIAREAANKVASTNGWNIVTENRPGAGGNLGIDAVAKAPADGYTIGLGQTSNLAINPTLYSSLPYDPETDLVPIGQVASAPLVLVVSTESPYKTIEEILAFARENPTELDYATSGNGTVAHLTVEQLQKLAGIQFTHIPYKGAAQGANDLIGGQVDMYMSSVPTLIGHIRNGKMRAIAVTSLNRTDDLPDVPTLAESGFPGFEAVTWFGLVGPKGMPPEAVQKLNTAFNAALQAEDVRAKYATQGAEASPGTAEAFGELIRTEKARWGQIVKDAGARVD
ncbi:Bug family tripartite tricarboxylate transporter substrate binding protein [Paracandidimonas soli]|uniref:Bug family tripartite tricarboxylate transporter substrate binding protein n=1 Tax=Paracandidimonas soli TaxID=1917182 RepID=UPI00333E1E67